ncbi:MAG: hypothetical protein C0443_00505 [Comamonadaceae bacterium]|nr:hypothetical protein [Comamonadaceae bacterium]
MPERAPVTPAAWIGQVLLYALFALVIGVFSRWPPYQVLPEGQALIKLSFVHQGKLVSDCRPTPPEELARLQPTMRAPLQCPRERSPVTVELELDGQLVHGQTAQPAGLSRDGNSVVYHKLQVPAGEHHLSVRIKDDIRSPGFNHRREARVTLRSAQIMVIDFNAESGEITLQ